LAFLWAEAVEEGADASPGGFGGSFCGFAQEVLKLGKDLLDWVQVRAVRWQKQEARTDTSDCLSDGWPFVTAQIVHDDDISRTERGHEELLDIFKEAGRVDRLIQNTGSIDPVAAQGGKEGHRPPVPIRHFGVEPLALGRPATQGRHVGLGPCLIDENKAFGIKPSLVFLPLAAPPGDLGA